LALRDDHFIFPTFSNKFYQPSLALELEIDYENFKNFDILILQTVWMVKPAFLGLFRKRGKSHLSN
jgi:hypothetical protein